MSYQVLNKSVLMERRAVYTAVMPVLMLLFMIAPAHAEWRILGPVRDSPDWLDLPAVEEAKQSEAQAEAEAEAMALRERWKLQEEQRRAGLPRSAEAVSQDGSARLGFGCNEQGAVYLSLIMSGYESQEPTLRLTHWVDDGPPDRVSWYTAPGSLELRAFTDRVFYVEQFLKQASAGEMVTLQVETYPHLVFATPDRETIVSQILENCLELTTEIDKKIPMSLQEEEMME